MNEPTKENPKPSKRSKRRPAMEPLGWDEIVSQPGMGGYLSFLNGPVPLPHLQGSATGLTPDPGVVPNPRIETAPEVTSSPDLPSAPESLLAPGVLPKQRVETTPEFISPPGVASHSAVDSDTAEHSQPSHQGGRPGGLSYRNATPEVVSIPAVPAGRLRIRRCAATHDGHSLGEEVLYQALWKAARLESAEARTIVIGWRGMSQLCRMTPKNCKINTQRLIRKLALEVLSPYNTPESIGTTYRVYSDQAVLQRRREVGLEWVVRSRGVEFVDPATGVTILPICAHTYQSEPPLI
jgi:hypothetical protein